MSKALISVVIPVFNEEKYINRCVNSVVNQTYENIELVLVDGGSTDGSPSIVDKWGEDWNKCRIDAMRAMNKSIDSVNPVRVFHTENNGVSASRNYGKARSHGEYITFVDGDDWLEPNAVENMYQAMISENTDMISMKFISRYGENNEENNAEIKSGLNNIMAAHFLSNNLLDGDMHCWGRLYKKDLLKDIWFEEGLTIGEDMLFMIEYVRKCRQVTLLDYEGYNYYRNPVGAMTKPFTIKAMDQIECYRRAERLVGLTDKLRKNMLISVMLTAGRIAVLPIEEWNEYSAQINELTETLKEYKTQKAISMLDKGYKFKVLLFSISPKLYLKLYHTHKTS